MTPCRPFNAVRKRGPKINGFGKTNPFKPYVRREVILSYQLIRECVLMEIFVVVAAADNV